MKCEQTQGQSVFDHGMSVKEYTFDLLNQLRGIPTEKVWKLPDWFCNRLTPYSDDIIDEYTRLHDIGKPVCRIVEDGKVHFPNHAEVSKRVYLEAGGNPIVANLIGWDMCIHTLNSNEIADLCEIWTAKDASTLLIVSLAELHSNARMFGGELGIESVSFKIKFKHVDKRGRQVFKHYFG